MTFDPAQSADHDVPRYDPPPLTPRAQAARDMRDSVEDLRNDEMLRHARCMAQLDALEANADAVVRTVDAIDEAEVERDLAERADRLRVLR